VAKAEAPDLSDLMTPSEVAEFLRVPASTLYAWRTNGSGPAAVRVGRHLRYRRRAVTDWLQAHESAGSGAAVAKA
jgi:excisionase family DNA binding protein